MKKLLLTLLLICFYGTYAYSQNDTLVKKLVYYYNHDDVQAFYDRGSEVWKSKNKSDGIAGWLRWMHGRTGDITAASYVRKERDFEIIRWEGEHLVVAFKLRPNGHGGFDDFGFDPFREPVSAAELSRIKSDNPLKTAFDSAVDRVISRFMIYNKPTGLSIGLLREGKTYTYNYGSVGKNVQQLPTDRSFYEIGSIVKTFTGTLLAQAVVEHKISLQDEVSRYLPGNYDNLSYNGHPLRIINLADYTSAMPPVQILRPFDESTAETSAAFFRGYTIHQFLEDVGKVKLDTLPGTRYTYSTAAVNLLAYILSEVYRRPFPELIKSKITGPMGMKDTKTYLTASDKRRFPVGYNAHGIQPDIEGPLDSLDLLHSTVHDMLIYLGQQIAENSAAIALTHQQFSNAKGEEAGLGWFLYKTSYGKAIGKGGNSVHMSCRAWAALEKKTGVIVFTNYNQMDWGDLVDDLMGVLLRPTQNFK